MHEAPPHFIERTRSGVGDCDLGAVPTVSDCRWLLDVVPGIQPRDDISSNDDADEIGREPILCRIVATSDGKISPLPSLASLSQTSKSLLETIELLYAVESHKVLTKLAYSSSPRSNAAGVAEESMEAAVGGRAWEMSDSLEREERQLVSVLNTSLADGGFKLMDQRDLDLCSALNAGYLLRLSLLPDIRNLECIGREFYPELYEGSNETGENGREDGGDNGGNALLFGGRVLIYRRGYSREITTGRLLLPKLDYLQASLVQRSSAALARKLGEFERNIDDRMRDLTSKLIDTMDGTRRRSSRQCRRFIVEVLENFGLSENEFIAGLISKNIDDVTNTTLDGMDDSSLFKNVSSRQSHYTRGSKMLKFARYLPSTSTVVSNGLDLHDALSPFLLCGPCDDMAGGNVRCLYDAPDSLHTKTQRTSAVSLLERISIQNTVDFFSKKGRHNLIRNYFKSSTLVEPAYEEVIVVWRPRRRKKPITIQPFYPPAWLYKVAEVYDLEDRLPKRKINTHDDGTGEFPMPLEIKAFYDVPMANIEAVLPKTKLIFRPADAIVFDLVSVFSFLAVAGSIRFDSPKLDLIALVSLIFFAVRTFFRYSNKYARYDLLVNKFITSKVSHRGPGALRYIVSEANTNRALRAMLIRDWLSSKGTMVGQLNDASLEEGKSYVSNISSVSGSHIDVDILSAIDDLTQLNLIDQEK
ncbi:hypothetical protein ACHAXA_008662 [Cyclostephanos tholiformis]|uniref:Uncharacterized protein n=1 Tax=Cyclostephanos tholiformis TaxID=382380 RepID=A0ABD3RFJ8_9STRA